MPAHAVVTRSTKRTPSVAVVGAGIMGTGIAGVFACAGFDVRLWSRRRSTLTQSTSDLRTHVSEVAFRRIRPTSDLAEALADVAFVSENVSENLVAKRRVFASLDRYAPPFAVLSSNTSSLSIDAIASKVQGRDRVLVCHWLNPPSLLLPVEVCCGSHTSKRTLSYTLSLLRKVGRRPILIAVDTPGFAWNRLQAAMLREAAYIVASGVASLEDVEYALQFGLAPRWASIPLSTILELGGLQTFVNIVDAVYPSLPSGEATPPLSVLLPKSSADAGPKWRRVRDERLQEILRAIATAKN